MVPGIQVDGQGHLYSPDSALLANERYQASLSNTIRGIEGHHSMVTHGPSPQALIL